LSYRRCDKCRTWRFCRGYIFYEPFEIERNYCKHQIIFLIEHLSILEIGEYPPDPQYSGYTDAGHKPIFGPKKHTPESLFSEVTLRLPLTGDDGDTLTHEIQSFNATLPQLSQSAKNALGYICGTKPKKMRYGEWLSGRKYSLNIKVLKK